MYSKNDYRYYLEHQLLTSDDYLAHYGIKGMKWKRHKVGFKELDTVINRDQEAFYARNSQDSNRALRQMREAQKKYDKTLLGRVDKKTHGLATSPYRILRNKARSNAEAKAREKAQSKRKKIRNSLAPRNQKVEITSFKSQRTGKDYKKR